MLSETGRKQAKSLGLSLKDIEINAVYSSPLRRALDTAEAIADYHQIMVHVEPDLRELEVGELEGLTIDKLGTDFSNFLIQWRHGEGSEKLPGGESLSDLRNRAWSTVQRIVDEYEGDVVVVSHYFVILSIICSALGLPVSSVRRFKIQVSSVSILDFKNGQSCLTSLGDICHLREG